jgi:hypothetical protein
MVGVGGIAGVISIPVYRKTGIPKKLHGLGVLNLHYINI